MSANLQARGGFSRPEQVFLLGLLVAALSLAVPGWFMFRHRQRLGMARSDLVALMAAGQRFQREYGTWPTQRSGLPGDVRYGGERPNREVMNVLRAVDGEGNRQHAVNDQRIAFLDVPAYEPGWSGLDAAGDFLDPWGRPYQVVLDTDFDNVCQAEGSVYGRLIGLGMAVWSCGPDRKSDTTDDLLSWTVSSDLAPAP